MTKPGKPSYTEAKAYHQICLSSFLLKTLERLVDRHIRDDVFGKNPLHINQHAYQSGKSTDTALNAVVSTTEKVLQTQEIAIGAFLDIEGAFNNTSIEAIISALLRHGVPPLFERWIASMLSNRCIISSFMWETMQVARVRGCPQGGNLLPLLWNLTKDKFLRDLNKAGYYYSIGFADDIAIIIRGKFPRPVSEVLQNVLKRLENWCNRTRFSLNPNKMSIVPFTSIKYKGPIKELFLFGSRIQLLTKFKYLELILDKGLNWKQHVQHTVTIAHRVF